MEKRRTRRMRKKGRERRGCQRELLERRGGRGEGGWRRGCGVREGALDF